MKTLSVLDWAAAIGLLVGAVLFFSGWGLLGLIVIGVPVITAGTVRQRERKKHRERIIE